MSTSIPADAELADVIQEFRRLDQHGVRTSRVIRSTFDQLYNGLHTGHYRWNQLSKTEKTHCGSVLEINLQREFEFHDGVVLDYRIAGVEVDCKYSQTMGGWMIPPEAQGRLCLVVWADDMSSRFSVGLVRVHAHLLNTGPNRDKKSTLNERGRETISWLFKDQPLPVNVLLQLSEDNVSRIMGMKHGTHRVNELFRSTLGMVVGRSVVATVAQQDDFMKRVRENGGARNALRPEGIIILGHDSAHGEIANALGVPAPGKGDFVSVRIVHAPCQGVGVAKIDGGFWRVAKDTDPTVPAPVLPRA